MGRKIPTKVTFLKAIYLCGLAIVYPSQLERLEIEDSAKLEDAPEVSRARSVYHAFWLSLGLIVLFSVIGAFAGFALKELHGMPSVVTINILQTIGAGLLLWGTLFVRGFEIQSYSCATLGERVNQWLYRAMYCTGTTIIICSLVWVAT